ncbi:protein of unknown function [Tenacibaculum jejuense]|uniref:Uncharacterized protein n=2 Tax=Tenacibaculum jejuense TaxID=584609 RepID=A0A238U867_9FLAO|nr:protein of unknown function [Tenacibaculum jejuense]
MILKSINFIVDLFNREIQEKFQVGSNVVIANRIIDAKDEIPVENLNKIVITLLHFEREHKSEKIYNLYLSLLSNFEDYYESLKFFEQTIFIQNKLMALEQNNLPQGIKNMKCIEIQDLKLTDIFSLYKTKSTIFQPSALYKVQILMD